jgi:hypothetical protein
VVRGYGCNDGWIKAAATADGGGAAALCAASMAGWWFDCSLCIANEVDDRCCGSWLMCVDVSRKKHVKVW